MSGSGINSSADNPGLSDTTCKSARAAAYNLPTHIACRANCCGFDIVAVKQAQVDELPKLRDNYDCFRVQTNTWAWNEYDTDRVERLYGEIKVAWDFIKKMDGSPDFSPVVQRTAQVTYNMIFLRKNTPKEKADASSSAPANGAVALPGAPTTSIPVIVPPRSVTPLPRLILAPRGRVAARTDAGRAVPVSPGPSTATRATPVSDSTTADALGASETQAPPPGALTSASGASSTAASGHATAMAGPGDAVPVIPGLTLLASAGQEPAPRPTLAPRKRAIRKAGKGKAVPAAAGPSTPAGDSHAGFAPGLEKPVGGPELKVATRALKPQAPSVPASCSVSSTTLVASGPTLAQAGHATAASGPAPAAPVASGSTVAAVSGEATAAPVGQAPAPSLLGPPAKEPGTEYIQYLKSLVASANTAKNQRNLDDFETIFAELLEIRKVHLPMRKDLPEEVHVCARAAQNALRSLGARGTKVASPARNSVVGSAPGVPTAQTAAKSTSASATMIAAKAQPTAAPASKSMSTATAAIQQQNQRSALSAPSAAHTPAAPPTSRTNPSANPVGTAEMQYLRDLATEARRLANDDGYNGLKRIEDILQMLKNIKEVDLPRRPDLPMGVIRAVDTILGVVSRCRRWSGSRTPPCPRVNPCGQTPALSVAVALPVAGPMAAPALPKTAALLVARPIVAAPAPQRLLLAQEPASFARPVVAAPAPTPQLLFRQQPVLPPVGPSRSLVPIATRIGRRPNAVVPLRRHDYVAARQPPLHPRLNQTPGSDGGSALDASAVTRTQKVSVVRGGPRQWELEAPAPAPPVVFPTAMRAWREPSPVVPVVNERKREEEWRATLYDAVFGLGVSMVLATGYIRNFEITTQERQPRDLFYCSNFRISPPCSSYSSYYCDSYYSAYLSFSSFSPCRPAMEGVSSPSPPYSSYSSYSSGCGKSPRAPY
ncbi:hypothetical protein BZA05DRAFT_421604 [Tricharina praecox]|uniref:uncharacterized protein n=1 Tax=Tricharina praecox TaxID=43433 RepID=UPI00221F9A68|nr:uncharacterized protein BZA05DRAFT_421604 [Tricharina praecox]KAI5844933.1 hypothetical protein BZA05DRAFT_421604 [Tricharina praecox]